MSIFSSIFRSRGKPTNATSGSAYRFFLGGTTSGNSSASLCRQKRYARRI